MDYVLQLQKCVDIQMIYIKFPEFGGCVMYILSVKMSSGTTLSSTAASWIQCQILGVV